MKFDRFPGFYFLNSRLHLIQFLFVGLLLSSCVTTSRFRYFNDIDQIKEPVANPREEKLILPFDNLYIKVLSVGEKNSKIFNTGDDMRINVPVTMYSYAVNENGNIDFPFVGSIHIADMTLEQAGNKIKTALTDYISNTAVIVKFIENKVTIMGEVQNQGIFTFTQDKVNIYEALALGGGITRFGDKKNVILTRQEGDKIINYRLNLSDSKITGKSFYYIHSNDVIIVEPLRITAWSQNNNASFTTFLTSVTTLLAIYITFFRTKTP